MKKLTLITLLMATTVHGKAPEGSCSHFMYSLFGLAQKDDYSRSFSKLYPDVSVQYHQPLRMVDIKSSNALKRTSKSTGFKSMMNVTSGKNYLENPHLDAIRFSVFDPKSKTNEVFFALKPPKTTINAELKNVLYENYIQKMNEVYSQQFKLTSEQQALLKQHTNAMSDRSVLFTVTDPAVHQEFQSGVLAVFSNQPSIPLPLESWTGKKVLRGDDELVVELGRFIMTNEKVAKEQETSTYLLSIVSTLLKSNPKLSKVFIKAAGPVQERMFMRYGFKRIQQTETGIHDFSKEALMEVSPAEFYAKTIGLLKSN